MDANGFSRPPILSPPPKRSTHSLQAELDYKERRLKLLGRDPGQLADHAKFAGLENEAATKEELIEDVRILRTQLLVKRQQEEDARIHAEGMKWLKEHESPTHPLHARPDPTPASSPPANSTHSIPLTSATLAPPTEPKINRFDYHDPAKYPVPDSDTRLSEDSWSVPDEDLFNFYDNSLDSMPDMNPSPRESSGSTSSPEQVASVASLNTSTNNRKRPRESLSSPVDHVSKSMRPSPSPALTRSTSHSSLDFDFGDLADSEELRRLVGGDVREDMREIRRDQKLQERALRQKKEQEENDAKLARELELSLQGNDDLGPTWVSSQAGPSSLSRNTSQATLDSNGRFRRPALPSSPPPPPLFDSSPYKNIHPIKKEDRLSIFDSPSRAKDQKPFAPARPAAVPNNVDFIDLGSDDDEDVVFNTAWPSGSRPQPKRELPWLKDEGTTYSNNGLSGIMPYQNQPSIYNSFTSPIANTWSTMQNAAQSVYNAGQAVFNPYPSGAGLDSYAGIGTGSDPITLADSEFYPGMSGISIADSALTARGLNPYNPANQELVDRYRERVDYLVHDPTRTTAEIKSLLENIRPDEDLPEKDREGTPEAMKYGLMNHQMLGLAWMRKMEEGSNKGGILADDMGLGKTIQALALMVSRRSSNPARKTTLIVAPVALLKQWEKEIRTKLKPDLEHQMTTYIFHGSKKKATWERLRTFDVVLTTFGTLANELKRKEGIDMRIKENPNWRPTSNADRLPLLGDECKWYRVIIDEAQCIKNKSTKASLAAAHLQAMTRFCMSGTPMMNNVGELYPLIRFLRIKPYSSAEKFSHDFTNPLKKGTGEGADKAMQKLQALLKAILLRRTKKSKIDGKPIIDLLERTTVSQHATFSEDELAFYRAVETQTQLQFNKYLKAGTVGRNYSNVLVLLLRLRQACCHPHLIKDFGQAAGSSDLSTEEMVNLAKQLAPDVVARIIESTGTEKPHGTECPICMDMTPNASIITPCGHSTCSECFAKISDPSQAIANGDGEGTHNNIKCPNCRGQIVLAKVINHNAFKEAHMPQLLDELAAVGLDDADESTDDSDGDDSDDDDDDDDADSEGDLKDFVVDDDEEVLTTTDEEEADGYRQGKTPFDKAMSKPKPKPKSKNGKGKGRANPRKEPRKTLAQLKREGQSNVRSRKKYIARLKKEYVPSSKIEKTLEILQGVMDGSDNEKTIIFSQFTSLLDLLEIPILAKGWDFKRYDGSMSSQARNEAVEVFTDRPRCRIMLVSLKAGNAGLNLVAASQVIILDPFWNPYIEEQAIDRAHRIGQMRPVRVHRVLVPETVEDRILALQEQKRAIIEGALDEKASAAVGRLDTRQLAYLFGVHH